jgi:hypothetical protein
MRFQYIIASEYPQCRDVSWNVLKNPARGSCRMDIYKKIPTEVVWEEWYLRDTMSGGAKRI